MTDNTTPREKTEYAPRKVAHAVTPADIATAREARLAALKAAEEAKSDESSDSED